MADFPEHFERRYQSHLKHLKLKGLQPKTIDAYARGMRRNGEYFSYQVDALSEDQPTDYFTASTTKPRSGCGASLRRRCRPPTSSPAFQTAICRVAKKFRKA